MEPRLDIGDRVFHLSGIIQRQWRAATVVGTADSHPWDCAPGMVIVQPDGIDVGHGVTIPIRLLQLADDEESGVFGVSRPTLPMEQSSKYAISERSPAPRRSQASKRSPKSNRAKVGT